MDRDLFGLTLAAFLVAASLVTAAGGLTPEEQLGKIMYQDQDFSLYQNQSCQTCHHHEAGFADPTNARDPCYTVVSTGSDGVRTVGRNAPTAAYAGCSPRLRWDDALGGYVGGLFWDGRAAGHILGDPLAEQAQGPPLNPVEMALPDAAALVEVVRTAGYRPLFLQVYGRDALDDDGTAFTCFARAIAAYERCGEVQTFSSRFDRGDLTARERSGRDLFAAHCAACHPSTAPPGAPGALFTNFTYLNIGIPTNPLAGNPGDPGLGGFLQGDYESPQPLVGDPHYPDQVGKFKVPTLRNAGVTAPYGHNGYFATLRDVVNFKNTRDTGAWEAPDVPDNLYDGGAFGEMNLTAEQVDDLVAFIMTLTDTVRMRP